MIYHQVQRQVDHTLQENHLNHFCVHDCLGYYDKNTHQRSHEHLNHEVLEDCNHRQNHLHYFLSHF